MQPYSKPIPGLSAIQSATFVGLFRDYEQELVGAGYNGQVVRLHLRSVAHFGIWLEFEGVALEAMDDQGVAAFEDAGDVPQSARFRPAAELTPEAVAAITEQVRVRVLRWFARSGLIEADDVREMLAGENSGFSLDVAVRVGAHDRAGLERLLRYCARPPFALERLDLDANRK
jgi:hypothetical protein